MYDQGGGFSAVCAGLFGLGTPTGSILRYEAAIKTGRFGLFANGTATEARRAKEILHRAMPGPRDLPP